MMNQFQTKLKKKCNLPNRVINNHKNEIFKTDFAGLKKRQKMQLQNRREIKAGVIIFRKCQSGLRYFA